MPSRVWELWFVLPSIDLAQREGRSHAGRLRRWKKRFDPSNSWPESSNLDKTWRRLWPIQNKYGASLPWDDLMILLDVVVLDYMGLNPLVLPVVGTMIGCQAECLGP